MTPPPSLPSVLPSSPALQDITATSAQLHSSLARVTTPAETPLYICALNSCYRLFPSNDRLMFHRKRDHDVEHHKDIITWNE